MIAQGAFTYDQVMNRIPWSVVLTMINDQGRTKKKSSDDEDVIENEEDELNFLGLS